MSIIISLLITISSIFTGSSQPVVPSPSACVAHVIVTGDYSSTHCANTGIWEDSDITDIALVLHDALALKFPRSLADSNGIDTLPSL